MIIILKLFLNENYFIPFVINLHVPYNSRCPHFVIIK